MISERCVASDAPLILQRLHLDWLQQAAVDVVVLRLDTVDPELSGNKWFKLVNHLDAARRAGAPGLISLGGPHSNHLHALAAAGHRFGFATVGLLRGHEQDTPTVADLQAWGMQIHWLGYGGFRARNLPGFWQPWQQRHRGYYCIPEGGGGLPAPWVALNSCQGCHRHWLRSAGTITTLSGLPPEPERPWRDWSSARPGGIR